MSFPHLNSTEFPNLGNVDVYGYRNDFDYSRWTPNTRLKLVNVRWNGDYEDVVKFESDAARDDWFDSLATDPECSVVLTSNLRLDKSQVKVPIPFDKAVQYNYLVVDVPIATSADNPLNYETSDGYLRWHFFVQDWQTTAPSTTVLTLALDFWTQYINSVGISYMMLERGHAPVAATDTDSYLANPMDSSDLLLAPDIDFGGETVSRGGKLIPFGNGQKYLCFASSCRASALGTLGELTDVGASFTDPAFANEPDYPDSTSRWGNQYRVNGYAWGSGKNYSNVTTPAGNPVTSDGRIPNNATVYAIEVDLADSFLASVMAKSPTFLKTLLGCFMVDQGLVSVKQDHRLAGYTLHELEGAAKDLGEVKLDRSMFSYPEKYERFAKLYTYPYAELEVTDNEGKAATVRIESTGSIRANSLTSVAFPYLNMRLFLTGIGGSGSQSYEWADLRGVHSEEMANSDWYRFCYDFGIPMHALFMDGQTAWNIHNYNREVGNARNSALISYHNAARQANNVYANTVAESNTAETNAHGTADTQNGNAARSADTMKTNTDNQANTLVSNNANTCAMNTQVTNNNNACLSANTALTNDAETARANYLNAIGSQTTRMANSVTQATTEIENQTTVATTTNDAASSVGSAMAGAATGAAIGSVVPGAGTAAGAVVGAAVGGAASAVANIVQGGYSIANANLVTQANSSVANLSTAANTTHQSLVNDQNTLMANLNVRTNTGTTNNTVANNSANCTAENNCATSNTNNTSSMMKTNASNLQSTQKTNASNAASTAKGNATRTKSTAQSNGAYTRNAAIAAAQDNLRNSQNIARANLADARNVDPVQLTQAGGDMASEYARTRGVQIKVRTQSRSAIRMAGDEFVRHGYALNQVWDVAESGLCLMKHFTYWKASDCWVYDTCQTNDTAQNSISALLTRGVTVWSDPEEVGRVNPYDN